MMTYSDIVELLEKEAKKHMLPFNGHFELTSKCNLNCPFCYEKDRINRIELDTNQWLRIIKESTECGLFRATFTGGEIFLRSDFEELYCKTYDLGVRLILLSNGLLVTEDICKVLQKRKPETISITLYGVSNDKYSLITGDSTGFDKLQKSLYLLKKYEIPVSLKVLALPLLEDSFRAIKAFADNIDLKIALTKYISKNSRIKTIDDWRLSPSAIKKYASLFDNDQIMGGQINALSECSIAQCNAGKGRFVVTPTGNLMGCMCYPEVQVPIGDRSFFQALTELRESLTLKNEVCLDCHTCLYNKSCGKCGGLNYAETGNYTICSSYRKALAKYKIL